MTASSADFLDADHGADAGQDLVRPIEVVGAGGRTGAIAVTPAPTSAGVFGIARTTGRGVPMASSIALAVIPAATERMPLAAGLRGGARAGGDVVGLDGQDRAGRGHGGLDHLDAGIRLAQLLAARLVHLGHRELLRRAPGGDQPAEQRLAHAATTDDQQLSHRGSVTNGRSD